MSDNFCQKLAPFLGAWENKRLLLPSPPSPAVHLGVLWDPQSLPAQARSTHPPPPPFQADRNWAVSLEPGNFLELSGAEGDSALARDRGQLQRGRGREAHGSGGWGSQSASPPPR